MLLVHHRLLAAASAGCMSKSGFFFFCSVSSSSLSGWVFSVSVSRVFCCFLLFSVSDSASDRISHRCVLGVLGVLRGQVGRYFACFIWCSVGRPCSWPSGGVGVKSSSSFFLRRFLFLVFLRCCCVLLGSFFICSGIFAVRLFLFRRFRDADSGIAGHIFLIRKVLI